MLAADLGDHPVGKYALLSIHTTCYSRPHHRIHPHFCPHPAAPSAHLGYLGLRVWGVYLYLDPAPRHAHALTPPALTLQPQPPTWDCGITAPSRVVRVPALTLYTSIEFMQPGMVLLLSPQDMPTNRV